ncbi:MAG: NAD-dependent epimerase/dehydratase family protein [Elusimicrobiota bacterium]|jgi:UDP-glucose 4-epimerase|nr:NAD-dependent epimerase/dehydratase family protein [Elusimicrobiota bacterium]
MKILITGGAGFIGSNIADEMINKGHKIVIIDNLSSGKKENINPKSKFYKVDISDKKRVSAVFKKEKPEILIHHAAQIDVRKSVSDPVFDAQINIIGSINLLSACVENKIKKVIFASSGGTIYGECGLKAPDEKAPANPLSPYGIAKHCVENYIKFFSAIYGLKYTILRYANVYGPRQDPHGEAGVVAIFSNAMLSNKDIKIFGDGKQTRDYVFVSDVAQANIMALTKADNEIINIGTNRLISVLDLIRIMSKETKYVKNPKTFPKRDGELFRSFLNINKAKKVLNWKPQIRIENGIKKTIEFFAVRKL